MNAAHWSRLRRIGAFAVMAGILALTLMTLDWHALAQSFTRLRPASALGCAAMVGLSQLLMAVRWSLLATPPSTSLRWNEVLVALHGNVFNLVTPAAIGSDVYKVAGLSGRRRGRAFSVGLVFIDRLIGVWSYAAIFLLAVALLPPRSLFGQDLAHRQWSVTLTLALPLFAGLFLVIPAFVFGAAGLLAQRLTTAYAPRVQQVQRAATVVIREHALARKALIIVLGPAAVIFWVFGALVLARATGLNLSLLPLTMIVILTEFVRLLPVSVQGIGVREASFAWLSSLAGAEAATAFVVCTVLYIVNTIVAAAVGAIAGLSLGGSSLDKRKESA